MKTEDEGCSFMGSVPPASSSAARLQRPIRPDTFLGGAQKGGTSALAEYLARHPACLVSDPKEPHVFARASHFRDPAAYARCFSGKIGVSAIIDASTSTLMHPGIAARIKATLEGPPRFIFILREPLARAVAAYGHAVRKGFERRPIETVFDLTADTLDDLVAAESARVEAASRDGMIGHRVLSERYDDPLWQFRYLGNGDYLRHLQPFVDAFGGERVLVLLAEQLRSDPEAVLGRVADFLGIDAAPFASLEPIEVNPTRTRRFNRLRHFLRRELGLKHLKERLPAATGLARIVFSEEPAPKLQPDVRARLQALYVPSYESIKTLASCDPWTFWATSDDHQRA